MKSFFSEHFFTVTLYINLKFQIQDSHSVHIWSGVTLRRWAQACGTTLEFDIEW